MPRFHHLSLVEQTAVHLREGIQQGLWRDGLPGVLRLAAQLGISKDAVRDALGSLEAEGLLEPAEPGRPRRIRSRQTSGGKAGPAREFRIGVLLHTAIAHEGSAMQRLLLRLQHDLAESGHPCFLASRALEELDFRLARVKRLVAAEVADAWVVVGGSTEILEWFAAGPIPALALGGRLGVKMAGVGADGVQAVKAATRRLLTLGHRRIVLLCSGGMRAPVPSRLVRAFTEALAEEGVAPGSYHLPDWEETPEGLRNALAALFRVTPPTALLVEQPAQAVAAIAFLARRGRRIPEDLSLLCFSMDSALEWLWPPLAHLHWDEAGPVRRVVEWARSVRRGECDTESVLVPAEFIDAGTLGPPAKPGGTGRRS